MSKFDMLDQMKQNFEKNLQFFNTSENVKVNQIWCFSHQNEAV